jgi:hypothetical protein
MVMTVIARDQVASDHLVYAWPFPIGPDCEVSCSDDEQVVMCPAWMVGDRLGPGRHRWRTPDPTRPVGVFFVLTAPVEVSFDMMTSFLIPNTGQGIRLRASGSLQVRCTDPGLLIAQFVGLPFDSVNDGVLRSVSRSVERMLARLLTRRVVMSGTPVAVTEAGMLPGIVEELIAYNPTAGAVFGVELIRMGHLVIAADDGSTPYLALPARNLDWSGDLHKVPPAVHPNGDAHGHGHPHGGQRPADDTLKGLPVVGPDTAPLGPTKRRAPTAPTIPPPDPKLATASGEIHVRAKTPSDAPAPRRAQPIEVPQSLDDITQPGIETAKVPGSTHAPAPHPNPATAASRGSILGIGMAPIGQAAVAGEIATKVPPGARVLVPGPNGLMQSATVRQLLQGYYELEVGSSGETIWVPINGVIPE